jgi:hypothetical protein
MAKSRSAKRLPKTGDDLTHVKSRTYGDHVRAKRGTYKKAKVNKAFKEEIKNVTHANVPAKIFNDAIEPYRRNFQGGQLWQRLVSLFRTQLTEDGSFDFGRIEKLEIHADYPLDRLLQVQATIKSASKNSILRVILEYNNPPDFSKTKYIDAYQLTVIGLFPDLKKKKARAVAVKSKLLDLTGPVVPFSAQLRIPATSKSFVVCLKIEGCMKGVVNDIRTTIGLCVVGAGTI